MLIYQLVNELYQEIREKYDENCRESDETEMVVNY